MEKETTFRAVIKNEFTWLIMLGGVLWATFVTIVIPLNNVQLTVLQIQQDITEIKKYDQRITANSNDLILIKDRLKIR